MYFPYLRGKQFELIALRELGVILTQNRSKVSLIIEPVKDFSTFRRALVDLRDGGINFNLIINPNKGSLIDDVPNLLMILNTELGTYTNYQIAIILDGKENQDQIINEIRDSVSTAGGISLIHNHAYDNIRDIVQRFSEVIPVVNNVINFSLTSRRYPRSFEANTIVGLDDFFQSQNKNADYANVGESQFSEEHLFYSQEGFKGFSDYLTIGDNYSESGMLPFAVAIHLSYADQNRRIRIKHLVSDTNDDRSDTAGKFAEALEKLILWCDQSNINSLAINQFRELHRTSHFPGLGTIKKLSIMHHIELVLSLI